MGNARGRAASRRLTSRHADEKPHRIQAHLSPIGSPSLPPLEQLERAEQSHLVLRLSSGITAAPFLPASGVND